MKNLSFPKIASTILLLTALLMTASTSASAGTVTFRSDDGSFAAVINITATSLNKTPNGTSNFNYNINFNYSVTLTGNVPSNFSFYNIAGVINTVDGQTGFQIPTSIPATGVTGIVTSYTQTHPDFNDFATAKPASVGAKQVTLTINGVGISSASKVVDVSSQAPLPATVKSFNATPSTEGVVLSWETAEETQVQSFTIEHSPNGAEWKPVGTVAAKGGSASGASYTLTDGVNAAANSYYRLSESDLNGNITYYKTVIVRNAQVQVTPQLFPNPNTGNTIHLTGLESQGQWQLSVIGADAQSKGTFSVSEGSVTLPELSAGLYFLSLRNAETGAVNTFRYSKL